LQKKGFFSIFLIFLDMLEDPLKFSTFIFLKVSKKNSKNGFTGSYQTLKGTKSWILVILAPTLWKWQTISDRPGTMCPPSGGIGLSKPLKKSNAKKLKKRCIYVFLTFGPIKKSQKTLKRKENQYQKIYQNHVNKTRSSTEFL